MTAFWLMAALAVPAVLAMAAIARGEAAPGGWLVAGGLAAGIVLGPMLAPFAVVTPHAQGLGAGAATLASAWLESGFLEELAKGAALWLILVPHRLGLRAVERAQGAVLISLGFGGYENLLYLAGTAHPASLVFMRGVISMPAHLGAGLAAAVVLLARPRADAVTAGLAFLAAWFFHGVFNQWALAWADALAGRAMPEHAPVTAVLLLALAPVVSALTVAQCWRHLLPKVLGGGPAASSWALVTAAVAASAWFIWHGLAARWVERPLMLLMALPFVLLPLALAWLTGTLARDAWHGRARLVQVRGQGEGREHTRRDVV